MQLTGDAGANSHDVMLSTRAAEVLQDYIVSRSDDFRPRWERESRISTHN